MHIVQRMAGRARANATLFAVLCMTTLASVIMAWASASQAGGFGPAASLATPRTHHTATLLSSGKVMIAGGANFASGSFWLASAELYDPASNAWSAASSMSIPRGYHTATLLPSGKVLVAGGTTNATGSIANAELYDPAANAWSDAGSMSTPRNLHSATLLASGKVLVAGGTNLTSNVASAELYDPASNTWSVASSMVSPRTQHTATLLPTGKVLVAGGYNAANAELYDPASNAWSAAGAITTPRISHTATLLPSGQVLLAGGTKIQEFGVTASAELYDPASNTWNAAGSLATARTAHTTTLLPSGQVLVAGGESASSGHVGPRIFASAELYDPASDRWSAAGTMANAHSSHTATLLPSGKVLVTGSRAFGPGVYVASAELYDASNYTWSTTGSMVSPRVDHTATLLPSGQVLVAGGLGLGPYPAPELASAEVYDPASNSWSAAGAMATGRGAHTATLLASGKVLMAGGTGTTSYPPAGIASAAVYVPASNMWIAVGSMATGRVYHTATLLPSGKVLVAGGMNTTGFLASAELYDPASDTWSAAGAMATARDRHTATLLPSGRVLVAGGEHPSAIVEGGTESLATAELYDPASNTWNAASAMATARYLPTATLLPSGKVLATGGGDSVAELYDPASNTWSTAGSMFDDRYFHTATLLPSGKVLIAGGYAASAELYDPASNTWSAASSISATVRNQHTATLLPSGKVLVAAGQDSEHYFLASAELYDLSSGAPLKAQAVEYYHAAFDHYFITTNGDEITKLDTGVFVGWARTGQTFNVYSQVGSMTASACRFFSASFAPKSSHFYTPDLAECIKLKTDSNWQFEGVVFYAPRPDALGNCPAGMQPIYRLYNNGQGGAPNHRYTTSFTLRSQMLAQGWLAEGYGPVGVIMCAPS